MINIDLFLTGNKFIVFLLMRMKVWNINLIGPFVVIDNGHRYVCTPTKSAGDFASVLLMLINTSKRERDRRRKEQTNK